MKKSTNKQMNIRFEERAILGKWSYLGSAITFYNAYNMSELYIDKNASRNLYFGDNYSGTDLKDGLTWSRDKIKFDSFDDEIMKKSDELFAGKDGFSDEVLSDKTLQDECFKIGHPRGYVFNYVIVHSGTILILFKDYLEENMSEYTYHIYSNCNHNEYSQEDIEKLLERALSGGEEYLKTDISEILRGKWKVYDEIEESEIMDYDGNLHADEAPMYALCPLFDRLDISKNGDCKTLRGDIIQIKNPDNSFTILTPKNTIMKVYGHNEEEDKFIIKNHWTGENHRGIYRKIGAEEFLFVDVEVRNELDEKYYVYKKF